MNDNKELAPEIQDPAILDAMLKQHRLEQMSRKWAPDESLSEEENSKLKLAFDERTAWLIKQQLSIISRLRKTGTTGPAKAGGKRAKRAPKDIRALEMKIMGGAT